MSHLVDWGNDAIRLRLALHEGRAVIVAFGPPDALEEIPLPLALAPAELLIAGGRLPQGQRHVGLGTSRELQYVSHHQVEDEGRAVLTVTQQTPAGVELCSTYTIVGGDPVVRVTQTVTNRGTAAVVLEHLSTVSLGGFARFRSPGWQDDVRLRIPHNTLFAEFNWTEHTLPALGIVDVGLSEDSPNSSKARIAVVGVGTQPTNEYLPMGALEDRRRDICWLWQIETNGSWQWEVGDHLAGVYLSVGGPTDQHHHWHRTLEPGQAFTSVPVAIAATRGRLEDALRPLTRYRRGIRRPHPDGAALPIVFNDFMNCLEGDPTEEKVRALITAAAAVGSDYFCIDAGWYSDAADWWRTVGAWTESGRRFPQGLISTIDEIR